MEYIETEYAREYRRLREKERAGILTDDEYEELFHMEQDAIKEECMIMQMLGIWGGQAMLIFICVEMLELTVFVVGAKLIKRNFEKELKRNV